MPLPQIADYLEDGEKLCAKQQPDADPPEWPEEQCLAGRISSAFPCSTEKGRVCSSEG